MEHRTFTRRNLPHLYYDDGTYFITYRLRDSLPVAIIAGLRDDLKSSKEPDDIKEKRIFIKYDQLLHNAASAGRIDLTQPNIAKINEDKLHEPDGKDYFLICYCIMPNHIHLVFRLLEGNRGISRIMKTIKGVSSRETNKILNTLGSIWQEESFDRLVRDDLELYNVINYVINNPVEAHLVNDWKDWKYTYINKLYI